MKVTETKRKVGHAGVLTERNTGLYPRRELQIGPALHKPFPEDLKALQEANREVQPFGFRTSIKETLNELRELAKRACEEGEGLGDPDMRRDGKHLEMFLMGAVAAMDRSDAEAVFRYTCACVEIRERLLVSEFEHLFRAGQASRDGGKKHSPRTSAVDAELAREIYAAARREGRAVTAQWLAERYAAKHGMPKRKTREGGRTKPLKLGSVVRQMRTFIRKWERGKKG